MNRALQSILRGAVLLVLVTVTATAAPIITATKDDNLAAGLRKLPGNTITYTITIGNTGDATATAVQFTDPDPANTSFVSVGTTPIARNDTFSAIGNVQISIAAPGLLANDNDADGDALTVSGVNTAGTQGNVTFNANGSFTFNPAPGFEGATTFTYTVNDGNGHTDTATVTINVAGMVWFINAAAGAGGDGRVATPFNTIASYLASAPTKDTGDNIFLYTGTYSTGLALGTNQRLIGQGALTSLQAITGLTPPTGSSAFPATGGTRPTIAVASGTGVTLGSGNTVNGLNVTNSNGSGITGSAVGTLTLADFGVTVTGGTALSLTTSGTVTATGANNTLTSTNNTALNLASVAIGAGGMTLKSVASTSAANGISLVSLGGGALTVTGDGSGFANGSGGSISNATTEAVRMLTNSGTITFRSMNFSMNTSAIDGILVDNNAGGTIVVNVTGCTFTGVTASVSQNKSLLQFEGGGASNVTANVQNTFFNSSRTYGCFATAAGTSVMNVTVNQCGFGTDVNTGAPVNQPGTTITNPPAFSLGVTNSSSALVDYTITNNTFWGADGTLGAIYAVTISGASTTASAHLNGSFNFNKIGKTGVTGSGAANGSAGLGLLPGTLGQFYATVIGNDIRQVNTFGVNFFNSVTAGNTDATLKIKGNTFAEPDTTGAPPFLRAIVVSPGNSGGANNPWKAEIGDTTGTVPANKNNISGAWQAGFFIRVTNNNNTSALTLPGLTPTSGATAAQVNTFVQNANTLPASSVGSALGTAGIIGGGPLPLIFAPGGVDAKSSLAANVSGRVGVPPAVAGVSLETSDHSNAIHVSSISKASREVRDAAGATPSRSPGIVRALTQAELDSLVAAALDRWTATGLTGEQLATLSNLKFEVADLPGWYLGEADGNRIRVDNDAGGHGWFIGAGPESDALFGNTGFQPVRPAGILPAGGHAF